MTFRSLILIGALLAAIPIAAQGVPWGATQGEWHVVEQLSSQTCYRMTSVPAGDDWRELAAFNTFRQAGRWVWQNRALCRQSPVFQ